MATTTKQDYYRVALELLAEGGAGRVTIANLCERLGLTKGSFYHHFDNATAFLHEAVDDWGRAAGDDLARAAREIPAPAERLELLRLMASSLDHEVESAIRTLGRTDPYVFAVQARVDASRREVTVETYLDADVAPDVAERLASMGLAVLVGAQHLDSPVDREELAELFDALRTLLAHRYPALRPAP